MLFQLNNSFVKESGDAEWDAWHAEMSKGDDGGGITWEDLNPFITSKDTGTSAKDYFESVTPSYADQADENWGGTSGDWLDGDSKPQPGNGWSDQNDEWWDGDSSKDPEAAAAKKKKKGAKKKSAAASYSAPSLAYTPAYTTPAASSASFPWLLVAGAGVAIYFLIIRKL